MLSTLHNDNQIQTCTSSIKTEGGRLSVSVCISLGRHVLCERCRLQPRAPGALLGRAVKSKRLFEVGKTPGRPVFLSFFSPFPSVEESRRLILTADEKQTLNLFLPPAVKVTVGVGWEVASERKHKQGGGDEIKKKA